MPPPSWIPDKGSGEAKGLPESGIAPENKECEISPGGTVKLKTPLADMLPPQYANCDVRELFPEFRPGQVGSTVSCT